MFFVLALRFKEVYLKILLDFFQKIVGFGVKPQKKKKTSSKNGKGVNLTVQWTVKEGEYKTIPPQIVFIKDL